MDASPFEVEKLALAHPIQIATTRLGRSPLLIASSVNLGDLKSVRELARNFDLVLALGKADQRYLSVLGEMRSESTMVIPFALLPFSFEKRAIRRAAIEGIREASINGDPVVIAGGDWLLRRDESIASIDTAQAAAVDLLSSCMSSILDLLMQSDREALSFRDLVSFLEKGSVFIPAQASARGDDRAELAARRLLEFYQDEYIHLSQSRRVLFSVYGGHSLTLGEVAVVARKIADQFAQDAEIISMMGIEKESDPDLRILSMCGGFELAEFSERSPFNSSELLLEEKAVRAEGEALLRGLAGRTSRSSQGLTRQRVFLSSPSDVRQERSAVSGVIDELNRITVDLFGVFLELVSWESHVVPGMGRPQGVINRQMDDIDVFIGILGSRIGSHTGVAVSGTVEEFQLALNSFERSGKPRILFYFSDRRRHGKGLAAAEQWLEVEKFRAEFERKGLYWTYSSVSRFERIVYRHLLRVAQEVKQSR